MVSHAHLYTLYQDELTSNSISSVRFQIKKSWFTFIKHTQQEFKGNSVGLFVEQS